MKPSESKNRNLKGTVTLETISKNEKRYRVLFDSMLLGVFYQGTDGRITDVKIIESVDFDFSPMSKNLPEISQIAWIARCKKFDLIVKDFINKYPDGTVVNIGCGLDTTYERINNISTLWYDLDLPDVIELKKKFLKETDKRKFISR